jgi:hypothetical protein
LKKDADVFEITLLPAPARVSPPSAAEQEHYQNNNQDRFHLASPYPSRKGPPAFNFSTAQRRGDRSPIASRSFRPDRLLLAIRVVMRMVMMMMVVVVTNNHHNLRRQRQGCSETEHDSKYRKNLFHKRNTLRPSL